jgi:3-hydroxyacyl-CoA dehydrogenase
MKVLGKQALGMFLVGTNQMVAGKYLRTRSKIANKLAYVMLVEIYQNHFGI